MAGDSPERDSSRRGTRRTWRLRFSKRGLWRMTARAALASTIVDPWIVFWLTGLKK
jgi:hypothetical protein